MLDLKRPNSHGDIAINLLSHTEHDHRLKTFPELGQVALIRAVAGSKQTPIDLGLPLDRVEGRLPKVARDGLAAIITRLNDLSVNPTMSATLRFRAIGDWYAMGGPGKPLLFLARSLQPGPEGQPVEKQNIMLMTYSDINPRTGRKEVRVSHGVNLDTGATVTLEDAPLSTYRGARYDADAGEYFMRA